MDGDEPSPGRNENHKQWKATRGMSLTYLKFIVFKSRLLLGCRVSAGFAVSEREIQPNAQSGDGLRKYPGLIKHQIELKKTG